MTWRRLAASGVVWLSLSLAISVRMPEIARESHYFYTELITIDVASSGWAKVGACAPACFSAVPTPLFGTWLPKLTTCALSQCRRCAIRACFLGVFDVQRDSRYRNPPPALAPPHVDRGVRGGSRRGASRSTTPTNPQQKNLRPRVTQSKT